MEIPNSLKSILFEPKGLYYFKSEHLSSDEPHYFIIVELDGLLFHMVVCTTRFENRVKYHKIAGFDPCTLVPLKPDKKNNELKEKCFVDCNTVFSMYSKEALQEKIENGSLEFKGHVSDSEYYQILNGIINSTEVEGSVIAFVKKVFDQFNA